MPSPQLPQGWRKRLRTRRLLTALAGPARTPGIESSCAHTPRACSRARLCTQAAGRCGWTPQPRKPCSPHPHKHGRRSPRKGMRQESGMETPAPRHRLLGGLTGGVESAAEPGSRGGRGGPRRAHHQNFGRVLQLSDHFWGPQRRRHHGLSSMTRHALHSGKGVADDQSARPAGLRAPGRLRRAGLGSGPGRRGAEDRSGAMAAHACCRPGGFSDAGDHAPWPRPDAGALLGSPICAPPRVAVRLRAESSGRPSRRLGLLRPSLCPSWPQKNVFRTEHSSYGRPCERCPGGLGQ